MAAIQVTRDGTGPRPDVSFAIACYNAGEFLKPAIESALAQNDVRIEVLIVDDGSSDESYERAQAMAQSDPRIRVFKTPQNGGPGAARNIALEKMRGDWYAILDSDDLIDPDRSRTLIDAADKMNADMVADDMLIFGEGLEPHSLIGTEVGRVARWIDMDLYLERSVLFSSKPGLGFLKPMIRRSVIEAQTLRYNKALRIGEDDELILRLLASGYTYWLVNMAMYRYRKHGESISHRLSVKNAALMLRAEEQLEARLDTKITQSKPYKRRIASLRRGLAFVTSVDQIKAGQYGAAIKTLLRFPSAFLLYKMPVQAVLARCFGKKP